MSISPTQLELKWGFSFEDLYRRESLVRLDTVFLEDLKISDIELFNRLMEARSNPSALARKQQYAAWAALSPAGIAKHHNGVLFKVPHKLDPLHLVPVETVTIDGVARLALPKDKLRRREGFKLTDPGMDLTHALDQAHYCIK